MKWNKLSTEDREEIRKLKKIGWSISSLAKKYKIDRRSIYYHLGYDINNCLPKEYKVKITHRWKRQKELTYKDYLEREKQRNKL